ncbi:MAG: hypothetical protein Q3971_04885 [Moraxella sp.]|nr:hypothetical protein [Moraxella sp.]
MTHDGRLLAGLPKNKGVISIKWANKVCAFDYQVDNTKDLTTQAVTCH